MTPKLRLPFYLEWFWHQTVQDQALPDLLKPGPFSLLGNTIASSRPMHPSFLDMKNQTVHVKILSLPGLDTARSGTGSGSDSKTTFGPMQFLSHCLF